MSVGVMNSIQSETFVECFKNLGMAFDKLSNTQLLPKGTIYNDDFNSLPFQNKNLSSKKTDSNLSEKNFELNENEKNSIENNNENYLENISITKKTLRKNIEETLNKEENNLKKENQKKKKIGRKGKKKKKNKILKEKIYSLRKNIKNNNNNNNKKEIELEENKKEYENNNNNKSSSDFDLNVESTSIGKKNFEEETETDINNKNFIEDNSKNKTIFFKDDEGWELKINILGLTLEMGPFVSQLKAKVVKNFIKKNEEDLSKMSIPKRKKWLSDFSECAEGLLN